MNKKKFLIENLKCGHKENDLGKTCQICNLRIINEILCFENYSSEDLIKENEKIKSNFSSWKKYNFQKVKEELKLKKKLKILDVGSGRHFIEKVFPELNGNDFFRLDLANRDYVDIIADLQKDSYFNCCFDAIICLNVLEHVYSFRDFFKNLSSLLKKDGVLMLSVPYNSGLHYLPHDYFRMSHYALKRLLNENDFEIKSLEAFYQKNINKIIRIFKNQNNNNIFSKILEKLIILQIRLYNKFFDKKVDNDLIDNVNPDQKKLYTEPMGYFLIAIKK